MLPGSASRREEMRLTLALAVPLDRLVVVDTAAPTAALTISVRGPTRSPRCAIAELASRRTQRLSDSSTPTMARLRPNCSW